MPEDSSRKPQTAASLAGAVLLCFALAHLLFVVTAWVCDKDPWDAESYARSDSSKYLRIARVGYLDEPEDIRRGNAGWFPGYPLAIRAGAALTGARPLAVGLALALAGQLGLLGVLAFLMRDLDEDRSFLALLMAACFPGAVYYSAVFPISICACFSLASVALFTRGRVLAAGLAGCVASFCYPTGGIASVSLALGVLLRRGQPLRQRARDLLLGPGVAALGLPAALAVFQAELGRATAYFEYQKQYGHTASFPLATFLEQAAKLSGDSLALRTVGLQTLVVAALLALAVVVFLRRRALLGEAGTLLLAQAALYWLVPLCVGSRLSHYRAHALMVGLVPLLALLPLRVLMALALGLAILSTGLTGLFLDGTLP
jgi:hypothetical protein